MTPLPFFACSLLWNWALGMTWLAIPLYGHAQGLSNAEIGLLFAAPVLVQVPFNLAGGAYTDRIGGRRIIVASSAVMVLAGLWFAVAQGFWMLLAGQLGLVLSRAAFWPANWSIASELPGGRSVQLGRLNSVTSLGQIAGTACCGFVLGAAGFGAAFLTIAGLGAAALAAGLAVPGSGPRPQAAAGHPFAAYGPLLRRRIIYYAMLCAYLSALPFSLSLSFYPLLLQHFGHDAQASGVLVALRAVGAIAAGVTVARFVRSGPRSAAPVAAGAAVAAAVGLLPLSAHFVPLALWLLVVGIAAGVMTLYFQITMSEASRLEERGSALALGGLGWAVSHLTTPLGMGLLADRWGIVAAFYALGGFALACTAAVAALRRWAFAATAARPGAP